VLTSLNLERPVLLVLHHPDEDGVYDHTRLADDVRAALLAFEVDLATQVGRVFSLSFFVRHLFTRSRQIVCSMGDNVTFNAALAANLGVAQGKCIAHSLNLVVRHTCQKVPDLITLTLTADSILKAGGSGKCLEHWRNVLRLNPNKAMTYANRFGGSVDNAKFRAEFFCHHLGVDNGACWR
jgi:hypothetical protein